MASNKKVQFGGTHVRAYDHGEQGLSLAVENFTAVSAPSNGEFIAGTAALQLPNVACQLAWLKADSNNADQVYFGGSGVTTPNGTADTTSGIELDAGDMWGPIPISNLNLMYGVSDTDAQKVEYFCLSS